MIPFDEAVFHFAGGNERLVVTYALSMRGQFLLHLLSALTGAALFSLWDERFGIAIGVGSAALSLLINVARQVKIGPAWVEARLGEEAS